MTSFDDSKKIINSKNLINECYRFNQRSLWPAIVPIPYCLLYMLQSGEYIFTPDFITFYKKLDLEETTVMWDMIHNPSKSTLQMILKLIFNARSYAPKELEKCRYFLIAASNLSSSMSSTEYTSQISRNECEQQGQSKANKIIATIRKANVVNIGTQQNFEEDFVPLPSDEDSNDNQSVQSHFESLSCPEHIDDMMTIVRKLRTQQYVVTGVNLSSSLSSECSPPVSSHSNHVTPQTNNIYDVFNLETLFTG